MLMLHLLCQCVVVVVVFALYLTQFRYTELCRVSARYNRAGAIFMALSLSVLNRHRATNGRLQLLDARNRKVGGLFCFLNVALKRGVEQAVEVEEKVLNRRCFRFAAAVFFWRRRSMMVVMMVMC